MILARRRERAGPPRQDLAGGYRSILLAFASTRDDLALDKAIELAVAHNARLTILVPVAKPSHFTCLADVDVEQLRDELVAHAQALVRRAGARVPCDVSLVTRCAPRESERAIALDLANGTYDLYITGTGRRDPGVFWGRMGSRVVRLAEAHGVACSQIPSTRTYSNRFVFAAEPVSEYDNAADKRAAADDPQQPLGPRSEGEPASDA